VHLDGTVPQDFPGPSVYVSIDSSGFEMFNNAIWPRAGSSMKAKTLSQSRRVRLSRLILVVVFADVAGSPLPWSRFTWCKKLARNMI
jgi:hypothetical protein